MEPGQEKEDRQNFPKRKGGTPKGARAKGSGAPKKTPKVQASACFSDHGLPKTSVFVRILHPQLVLKAHNSWV